MWGALRNTIQADDIVFHSVRLRSSVHAWTDGQIIPQVDPRAADGLGYAYGILWATAYVFCGNIETANWFLDGYRECNLYFLHDWVRDCDVLCVVNKISKHKVAAAMAGILYLAEPYHILNL